MVEEAEMEEFVEQCEEAEQWLMKKIAEQEALGATEEPVLKSEAVARRAMPIEKKLQSLLKRRRRPQPPPPAPENTTTTTEATPEGQQDTATPTTEPEGTQQTEEGEVKVKVEEGEETQQELQEEKSTIL